MVKVDQGVKGRGKKGLVKIGCYPKEIIEWITTIPYSSFIVEPMYKIVKEFYLSIRKGEKELEVLYSNEGGVDVDTDNCRVMTIENLDIDNQLHNIAKTLVTAYKKYHMVFLESNPIAILASGQVIPIDLAAIFDETALYQFSGEEEELLSFTLDTEGTEEEKTIRRLDQSTGSSLKFTLLNPDGSVWTLVAGGGASVVYTDAILNAGHGNRLGNYGEYSGDPPEDLVYQYVKNVLACVKRSSADLHYILIGGGIANFTKVDVTFRGINKAIEEESDFLKKKSHIIVRRGGPNYQIALQQLSQVCTRLDIKHEVYGPDTPITDMIKFNPEPLTHSVNNAFPSDLKWEPNKVTVNGPCFIYGFQTVVLQRMLDFDKLSNRPPSVKALIDPTRNEMNVTAYYGDQALLIPVYKSVIRAINKHKVTSVINFSSFRSAYQSTLECLQHVDCVTVIAEGMPEADAFELRNYARSHSKTVIGPATVGGILGGQFRIGNTGGELTNLAKCGLHQKGDIAIATRSGGLLNEMINIAKNVSLIHTAISIGGDRYPGTDFLDLALSYQENPEIKLIIVLGEIGGTQEIKLAQAVKAGKISKPVVAWCTGTSAEHLSENIQFGHAGASATQAMESAVCKNAYMRQCGIHVPDTFEHIGNLIKNVYPGIGLKADSPDLSWITKRKPVKFFSSFTDERKELQYNGHELSCMDLSLGNIIGNLWFKKEFSPPAAKFLEMVLVVSADHGPCVSGAQNTIITTRAGKDLISSLCSGLLTIGPRFGGAVNEAARLFYQASLSGKSANEFISQMKSTGTLIAGIGHKYKTKHNPDTRVAILDKYFQQHFSHHPTIDFAREVETITLTKRNNLILNVDGYIGAAMVDLLINEKVDNIMELLDFDFMNGLFVLARTIGFIGHHIDQKRLKQELYRCPTDEVCYL